MTAAGQPEWITAGATWLLIGITAAIILGVQLGRAIRAAWIRTGRRLDADLPRLLLNDYSVCDLELCDQVATTVTDLPRGGCFLSCDEHTSAVRGWIG